MTRGVAVCLFKKHRRHVVNSVLCRGQQASMSQVVWHNGLDSTDVHVKSSVQALRTPPLLIELPLFSPLLILISTF